MASICAAVHTMTFVFSSADALPEREHSINADSPKTSSVLYTLVTVPRPLLVRRPIFTFPDMTRKMFVAVSPGEYMVWPCAKDRIVEMRRYFKGSSIFFLIGRVGGSKIGLLLNRKHTSVI